MMEIQQGLPAAINVRVTQFQTGGLQTFQALIPIGTLASIAVRRAFGLISVVFAVGLLVAMVMVYLRARRRFGRQSMRMIDSARCGFGTELILTRQQVSRWTIHDTGQKAYLYCHRMSVRVKCDSTDAPQLREQLTSWLGAPLALQRRGSQRARWIAVAVSLSGLGLIAFAVVLERVACIVAGVPMLIVGSAFFGALSQRVPQVAPPSSSTQVLK